MSSMRNWMLGAMVVAGAAGLGSVPAQAAEFGIYARGPVAYVPPCPGPGYVWMDGYMADGYWIPGRWEFVGYRDRDRDRFERRDFDRRDFDRHDRDRHDWGRDSYRHDDRDRRKHVEGIPAKGSLSFMEGPPFLWLWGVMVL